MLERHSLPKLLKYYLLELILEGKRGNLTPIQLLCILHCGTSTGALIRALILPLSPIAVTLLFQAPTGFYGRNSPLFLIPTSKGCSNANVPLHWQIRDHRWCDHRCQPRAACRTMSQPSSPHTWHGTGWTRWHSHT